MKILLLARNFWPELTGIGFYEADLADWLHDRGHLVSVVTTPPHYPGWKIDAAEYTQFWRRDHRKPYPILRCPLYVPKRLTAATRLAHSASFGLSGLPAVFAEAARFRPDIVGAVMPTLAAAPAALAAGVAFRARSWLHVQDLEVDAAVGLGMLGGAPSRMALRFERAMLRRFDCITTITPAMRARLVEKQLGDRDPAGHSELDRHGQDPSPFRRSIVAGLLGASRRCDRRTLLGQSGREAGARADR